MTNTTLSLTRFNSEAHKAHTLNPIPTPSVSHFLLETHKVHNYDPVTALSLTHFFYSTEVHVVQAIIGGFIS